MAIYCIGDIRADVFINLKDYVVSTSNVSLGGTVANFSVVSRKLGQDIKLVGTAANDAVGDFHTEELSSFGIYGSYLTRTRDGMNSIIKEINNGFKEQITQAKTYTAAGDDMKRRLSVAINKAKK